MRDPVPPALLYTTPRVNPVIPRVNPEIPRVNPELPRINPDILISQVNLHLLNLKL